jgi:hypothetical protein
MDSECQMLPYSMGESKCEQALLDLQTMQSNIVNHTPLKINCTGKYYPIESMYIQVRG